VNDAGARVVLSQRSQLRLLDRLSWACPSVAAYLCMDSEQIDDEREAERSPLMEPELWEYVGRNATDEITGGGWVSSYTGQTMSADEMPEYRDNAVAKLAPYLRPSARVLEIGCASGITMFAVAPRVGHYRAIDLSGPIVDYCRTRAAAEGLGHVRVDRMAAHE